MQDRASNAAEITRREFWVKISTSPRSPIPLGTEKIKPAEADCREPVGLAPTFGAVKRGWQGFGQFDAANVWQIGARRPVLC
jgi:hypothetical protein